MVFGTRDRRRLPWSEVVVNFGADDRHWSAVSAGRVRITGAPSRRRRCDSRWLGLMQRHGSTGDRCSIVVHGEMSVREPGHLSVLMGGMVVVSGIIRAWELFDHLG